MPDDMMSPIKKNRHRGQNKRIAFSHENITIDQAKNLITSDKNNTNEIGNSLLARISNENLGDSDTHKIEAKSGKHSEFHLNIKSNQKKGNKNESKKNSKKRNGNDTSPSSKKQKINEDISEVKDIDGNLNSNDGLKQSESLSRRATKKIRFQKLLEEKKMKVQTTMQQNVLSYISNWKYNRANWKFEKLKQIWLLQNLYDSTKIDDKIWCTVIEYFNNSKGAVHKKILEEAIKIVEELDAAGDETNIKLKRARDIVQNLQD